MNAVTAQELSQIQLDVAFAACDQAFKVYRKSITRDAYGSETEIFNLIGNINIGVREPTATHLQNYDYLIGSLAAWHVQAPVIVPTGSNTIPGSSVLHQDHLVQVNGSQVLVVQVMLEPRSLHALISMIATEVL